MATRVSVANCPSFQANVCRDAPVQGNLIQDQHTLMDHMSAAVLPKLIFLKPRFVQFCVIAVGIVIYSLSSSSLVQALVKYLNPLNGGYDNVIVDRYSKTQHRCIALQRWLPVVQYVGQFYCQ